MSSTDENILRGTIHILVDNSDPLNKVFKPIYPKTAADQIEGLDEVIESKIQEIPATSSSTFGLTKIGNNISCIDGIISLTSENIISALGFTPVTATDKINSANTADKLASTVNIDGFSFNGTNDINRCTTCTTASDVPIKAVSIANFNLKNGALIIIKFVNANSASSIALNVNNTGAKQIKYHGEIISPRYIKANSIYTFLFNGESFDLIGDIHADTNAVTGVRGSAESDYHTGNVTITPESIGLGNVNNVTDNLKNVLSAQHLTTSRTIDGVDFDGSENIIHYGQCNTQSDNPVKLVSCKNFILQTGAIITVTFNNTNIANGLALDVNNTGAKAIKYRNANIDPTVLDAGRTYTFVYDGTNYQFIGDINTNVNLVTGVKGSNETDFQTGNVIITKSSLGIDKVENTADNEKQVLSAKKLATARTISLTNGATGAANFDGSEDLAINVTSLNADKLTGTASIDITGTANKANKLSEAKTISLENGATGSADFDGSENVAIDVTELDASKLTGTATINTTGNAATANKLFEAKTISLANGATGSANFDGSKNITIDVTALDASKLTGTATINTTGNAATANKLTTAKTINLTNGATGSADFDGSKNITIDVTALDASKLTGTANINTTGTASQANKLANKKTITITDGVHYSESTEFDGSENITLKLPETINTTFAGVIEEAQSAIKDANGNVINETYAMLNSPALTGEPTAPTPNLNDVSNKIATTEFVSRASSSLHYCHCNTESDIAVKEVTCEGFILKTGASIIVTFDQDNATIKPSLKINDLNAAPIMYRGSNIAYNYLQAGRTYHFIYDGTNYQLVGDLDTNLVTGVKGVAESEYRRNNVSISATDIGLNLVNNTADADKIVAEAIKATQDSAGNVINTTYVKKVDKIDTASLADVATKAEQDINGKAITTTYAKLESPVFTGEPLAPTAAVGTSTKQIATTEFVKNEIDLVKNTTSDLNSDIADITNNLNTLESNINTAITNKQAKSDALTSISGLITTENKMIYTTAANTYDTTDLTNFARTILDDANATEVRTTIQALGKDEKAKNSEKADIATSDVDGNKISTTYAKINNANLTGVPTAPTAEEGTSTDQIATTKFVTTEVAKLNTANETLNTAINDVVQDLNSINNDLTNQLNNKQAKSAALTSISGLVTDENKMIYTTSANTYETTTVTLFARTMLDDENAEDVRTTIQALGKDETAVRAENDANGNNIATTYAPINNANLTGIPTAPTATAGSNTQQVANTAYVKSEIDRLIVADSDLLETIETLKNSLESEQGNIFDVLNGKQEKNAALTSISGLSTAGNEMIYTTAENTYATTPITPFTLTVLNNADATTFRNTINALGKTEDAANAKKLGGINASDYALKTNSALTGTPTAPTAANNSNSEQIANTQFVRAANIHYGQCDSSINTAIKVVACNSFLLNTGAEIIVKFINDNLAENPQLNVNDTGAKNIKYNGQFITANVLRANKFYHFVYDGVDYQLVGDLDTNLITGIKGSAETEYRTGNVIITKDDIGLNNVENTADANKHVAEAVKAIQDGSGNIITSTYVRKDESINNAIDAVNATNAVNDANGNEISTTYATINNTTLTGIPTAPTAAEGTSTTQIATTEFVANEVTKLNTANNNLSTAINTIKTNLDAADSALDTKINNKQDKHAALTSISGLTTAADKMIYTTAENTYKTTDLTEFARSVLDDSTSAEVRTTIGALGKEEKAKNSEKADLATKAEQDVNGAIISTTYAKINNPIFTGVPQAPNPVDGTANTQIATTAFVQIGIDKLTAANAELLAQITSLEELMGEDTADLLTAIDGKQNKHAALTSISGLKTAADKMIYTTAENVYTTTDLTEFARSILGSNNASAVRNVINALGKNEDAANAKKLGGLSAADYALKADSNLSGTPTAPTAVAGTNTTQIATTEFVNTAVTTALNALVGNTGSELDTLEKIANAIKTNNETINEKQDKHTSLTSIAGLSAVKDKLLYTTALDTYSTTDLTDFARTILDDVNAEAVRNTINALGKDEDAANAKKLGGLSASDYALKTDSNLTGTPTAPTADFGTNSTQIATTAFVQAAVSNLVGAAPATLNTLEEIANAINNNANIYSVLTEAIEGKQDKHAALTSISGLTTAADKMIYTTAANTYKTTDLTNFARSILAGINAAAVRTTINALGKDEDAENAKKLGGVSAAAYALKTDSNLIGTPTAPTADAGTSTTQIATTEFVTNAVNNAINILSGNTSTDLNSLEKLVNLISTNNTTLTSTINGKQDKHAALTSISGLVTGENKMIYTTSANTYETTTITPFARTILGDVNAEDVRTTIQALGKEDTAIRAENDANGNNITTTYAPINNANLTGVPTAPTATAGSNTQQIANTAYVKSEIDRLIATDSDLLETIETLKNSLESEQGNIFEVLNGKQDKHAALTSISGLSTTADKMIYTTEANIYATTDLTSFARSILAGTDAAAIREIIGALSSDSTIAKATADSNGNNIIETYATKISPEFSGTPTAPTADAGTNNTQIATTAFVNTAIANNHYSTSIVVGGATATANTAVNEGNIYLKLFDNTINRSNVQLHAGNNVSLNSDADGVITINSHDTTYKTATTSTNGLMSADDKNKLTNIEANANNYSLPHATADKLGGIKTGNNITNTNGTISVTSENIINALGFTPANNNINVNNVQQIAATDNNSYPLLATGTNDKTQSSADTALFSAQVKLNPAQNSIAATTFIGNLSGTATQATMDSDGNNIANTYAPLNSPNFSGTPAAPTANIGTNTTQIANTEFVQSAISAVKGSVSSKYDTLEKIATVLNGSLTDYSTLVTSLDNKQPISNILTNLSGLSTAKNQILYTTAKDTFTTAPISDFVVSLLDDANESTFRASIGALSTGDTAYDSSQLGGYSASVYAKLASPKFTGTPSAPTATKGTSTRQIATTEFVMSAIADLVDSAPDTLNTLGEIATALNNNADIYNTLNNAIGTKQNAHAALSSISGLTTSADKMIYTTDADTYAVTGLTNFARTILDDANATEVRNTIKALGTEETAVDSNKLGGSSAADYAKLNNPTFTGIPNAPTASASTNTDQIATTKFVHSVANAAASAANTHYTTKLIVGGSTATANAAVTSGNVYLRLFDDSTNRNDVQIKAGTGITIGSNSTGVITITNSSTNTDTKVTQNKSTTNATYPILLTPTADATANVNATNAIFGAGVKVNPSTSAVTATTFIGALSGTATNADQLGGTAAANYALLASPSFTGTPSAPTATTGTNTTQIATTEFVQTAINNGHYTTKLIAGDASATVNKAVSSGNIYLRLFDDSNHRNDIQLKAGTGITVGSNSTGVITITNSSTNTDTKVTQNKSITNATYPILLTPTADANANVTATNAIFGSGVKVNPSTSAITATTFIGALSGTATNADQLGGTVAANYAKLDSPSFSGTPSAPTAIAGTNTDQIATTAFVQTAATNANTHYTTKLIVGGSTATANAAVTSGNVYLRLFDDSNHRNNIQLKAGTGITVGSNSTGVITITNSSTNTDTKVTQNKSTTNATYPILLTPTADATANVNATNAIFGSGVKVNPSTSAITATTFIGALSGTATNANSLGGSPASEYAKLTSPNFNGTPTAPTASASSNDTTIATTAFVTSAIAALVGSAPATLNTLEEIASVIGSTSNLAGTLMEAIGNKQNAHAALSSIAGLTTSANKMIYTTAANTYTTTDLTATGINLVGATDAAAARTIIGAISAGGTVSSATNASQLGGISASLYAKLDSPSFSGTPSAPTATASTNNTQIANTAFVQSAISAVKGSVSSKYDTLEKIATVLNGSLTDYSTLVTSLDNKQPISNILTNLSGLSTAKNQILYTTAKDTFTTAPISDFVVSLLDDANESTFRASIGALSTGDTAYDSSQLGGYSASVYAKLASPKFTGTPSAPTATKGTSTRQIATTEFVMSAIADLVDSAPDTLNTLGEIATALNNNADIYNTLNNAIGTKQNSHAALSSISGLTTSADKMIYTTDADTYAVTGLTNFARTILDDVNATEVRNTIKALGVEETAVDSNKLGGSSAADYAKLNNPTFTGIPNAPTATAGTNTDQIATTAFVQAAATNANTHYTTKLIVGGSTATANAAVTSGNVYLRLFDDSNHRNNIQLKAGTGIKVGSDSTGIITITNSSTNTDTKVTQNKSTTNATYPILLTPTANATANVNATNAIFGSGVKVNPSTSAVTATTFIGALSGTATNADQLGGTVAANYALLDSPNFTGTPSAPTATAGTNTTQIATTEFVQTAINNGHYTTKLIVGGSTATTNAAVTSGNVYLRLFDDSNHRNDIQVKAGTGITVGSDSTGVITITNSSTNTDTKVTQNKSTTNATYPILLTPTANANANVTATNAIFGTGVKVNPSTSAVTATTFIGALSGTATNANQLGGTVAANYAKLDSPSFSGTPSAPTAAASTNNTQIATTEFVQTAISAVKGSVSSKYDTLEKIATALNGSLTDYSTLVTSLDNKQPINNILTNLSGLSTAKNQILYTTAKDTFTTAPISDFVISLLDDANESTFRASIGALSTGDTAYDSSQLGGYSASVYAKLASPKFTGTPSAPTATKGTSTRQIATTEFVMSAIADLIGSAPDTLNTLGEIATALNNNADIYNTLNNAIGTKQNAHAALSSISGLTTSADKMIYTTGTDTYAVTGLTNFARTILDDANATEVRNTIKALGAEETAVDSNKLGGSSAADYALLDSPSFSGTPTAPTAASTSNNTTVATTAFVKTAAAAANTHYTTKLIVGGSTATANAAVTSGNIYLRLFDDSNHRNNVQLKAGTGITVGSDSTGVITITNSSTNTDTKVTQNKSTTNATYPILLTPTANATANVTATNAIFGSGVKVNPSTSAITATTFIGALSGTATNASKLGNSDAADYAKLASPSFSGTPTAPTATAGTNTTQIATTEFVQTAATNANTHYTTKLIVGGSTATANAAVTSGNVYLRLFDDSNHRNNVQLKAGAGITVGSDSTGVITITNSSTNTDTKVSFTSDTSSTTYPLLFKNSTGTTTTAAGTRFNTGIYATPSTSSITATTFIGTLSGTATNANQLGGTAAANYAKLDSPSFSGTPSAPTATASTNNTQIANTAFVQSAISAVKGSVSSKYDTLEKIATILDGSLTDYSTLVTSLDNKQPISNILTNLSGLSTAKNQILYTTAKDTFTTAPISDFVVSLLDDANESTFRASIGALSTGDTAYDSSQLGGYSASVYAKLASPKFTGTPSAPTATAGTNNTQVANTEFVNTAIANSHYETKLIAGDASATSNTEVSSGDVYLRLFDNATHRNNIQLHAGTGITIGSNSTGVVTITNSEPNTDTLVEQRKMNIDANYPILFVPVANVSATQAAKHTGFGTGIKANPYKSRITATEFVGSLSGTATNATNLAGESAAMYLMKPTPFTTTILSSAWNDYTDPNGVYNYSVTISNSYLHEVDVINVIINRESQVTANKAKICPTNESGEGTLTLYSQDRPESSINITYFSVPLQYVPA